MDHVEPLKKPSTDLGSESLLNQQKNTFLNNALDAILSVDKNDRITEFNPSAEKVFGYLRSEVLGQGVTELIIPERFRETYKKGMAHYLATGEGPFMDRRLELVALRKDRTEFPIELTIARLQIEPLLLTGFIRDISDRKQAESLLKNSKKALEKTVTSQTSELGKSEERFRLMVSAIKDYAIFMLDEAGHIITWNTGAENLKGYKASEIVGQHFSKFYPQKDILNRKPEFELQEATRVGRFEDEGYRLKKDGSLFWANVIITAVRNDEGKLIGFSKVTRDLSERKRYEDNLSYMRDQLALELKEKTNELVQSRDQLNVILKGIHDGITVLDENGNFVYANESGAKMCGFASAKEFLAAKTEDVMSKFEIMDEDGRPFPTSRLPGRLALLGVEDPTEIIVRFRYKDTTEERWSIVKANPIYDETRKVRLAVTIFKDFTDRKRSEDAIKYLDEASRILISSLDYEQTLAQIAKLAVPKIADWCAINLRVEGEDLPRSVAIEHFDRKKLDLVAKFQARYPNNWDAKTGAANVLRTGISELYTEIPDELLRVSCQDEDHYQMALALGLKSGMVVPLSSRGKTFGVITFISAESGRRYTPTDLTFAEELARRAGVAIDNAILYSEAEAEKNKSKDALEKMAKLAEVAASANQAKSLFLANMSHEIRTPLGAILGFTDFLNDLTLSPVDRTKYTDIINRNGQLLTQLIDDILDLSKVEAGHLEVECLEISLTTLISDIASLMSLRAQEKGLNFYVEIDPRTPDFIYSDPTRLRQILINIIGNAIKFTEKGGVKILVQPDSSNLKNISFIIEDSGLGILPHNRERLFEWFTQADPSTTRKFGGTGLGLALSRKLARSLGGDIAFLDSQMPGTRFHIFIATHLDKNQEAKLVQKPAFFISSEKIKLQDAPPALQLTGMRILLVDDSADNRVLIESILKRKGIFVDLATNGREGVEKAISNSYDLVLMDIQMPILDGLQATIELRNQGYHKPIVALTAHAMKEEREKTRAAGCDAHVTKPIEVSKLLTLLAKYRGLPAS